jgi:hypothetical protein
MPTRTTTRIPPRTRPPRRRLPSPLARPSHERVQFSDFSEDKKLFTLVVSRNGDTQILDKRSTRLSCVRILYNNPSSTIIFSSGLRTFFRCFCSSLHSARKHHRPLLLLACYYAACCSCCSLHAAVAAGHSHALLRSVLFSSSLSIPHFSVRAFGRLGKKRIEGLGNWRARREISWNLGVCLG